MTESDAPEFLYIFTGLTRIFPLKGENFELGEVSKAYFKALRRYPLAAVRAGAEECIARGKYFPKPHEWSNRIPRRDIGEEIPPMTMIEIAEYRDAEDRHYDGEPCDCSECRAAGVEHQPLRFVPNFDDNDLTIKGRIGARVVSRGHWAHGFELKRWYRLHDEFWARWHALMQTSMADKQRLKRMPFHERLAEIYKPRPTPLRFAVQDESREPGEDG